MQVSVETTSTLERRMTIQVPAEKVDAAVQDRLKQTAHNVRIDGFRPGKVPMSIVKKRFGPGVRQEVVSELMRNHFVEAITQESVNPAGMPDIEPKQNVEGQPLEFVATFEVYPEVELKTLEGETVERPTSEVTDDDVDALIADLRQQRADWEEVERPAEQNDRVNINFEGFIDGEAFDGGKGENHDLTLGSGTFIPGFEDQLIGAKAGDDKDVVVTFPEDYQAEALAGKEATFKVHVNKVEAQKLPELNDEFFAGFGVSEGGEEAFRAEVRKNMENQLQQTLRNAVKQAAFDALLNVNEIEVPKALVDNEIDNLRRQAAQQYNLGDNFDFRQIPGDLFKDQAEKNVKLGLLVSEVVKVNDMKADDADVDKLINEMAQSYQQPEQVIEYYRSNKDLMEQVRGAALEQQVVDKLLAQAQVTDVTKTFKELTAPAQ